MITVAEYIAWRTPKVAEALHQWIRRAKITALSFEQWERIMQERPLPGRAGLLRGEKAV